MKLPSNWREKSDMNMKNLLPEWSTVVSPGEYKIDDQMEAWLRNANVKKECFSGIDVGKAWGLFQSWKDARSLLFTLALGVSLGDRCPFCGGIKAHTEVCDFDTWCKENLSKP